MLQKGEYRGILAKLGGNKMKKEIVKRIIMSLAGVLICAFSVGMFKLAALGVDPFQTFVAGLYKMIPMQFGTLYMIINIVLLVFMLLCNRKLIGIATFINLFLFGYMTQFCLEMLQKIFPAPSFGLRLVILAVAIVIMCFGSAFYMTADLGVSTYDAVAITMADRWKLGKFKYLRIATDVVCVVLGCVIFLIAGGQWSEVPTIAGIGTIVTAFFMGPLIDFFNRKVAIPILKGKK